MIDLFNDAISTPQVIYSIKCQNYYGGWTDEGMEVTTACFKILSQHSFFTWPLKCIEHFCL